MISTHRQFKKLLQQMPKVTWLKFGLALCLFGAIPSSLDIFSAALDKDNFLLSNGFLYFAASAMALGALICVIAFMLWASEGFKKLNK